MEFKVIYLKKKSKRSHSFTIICLFVLKNDIGNTFYKCGRNNNNIPGHEMRKKFLLILLNVTFKTTENV